MVNKLWAVIALAILGISAASAAEDVKKFSLPTTPREVFVSYNVQVEIIPSNQNLMVVETSSEEMKNFSYSYRDGRLVLKRKKKKYNFLGREDIEVKLYVANISQITALNASGASQIELESSSALGLRAIDVSGASKVYFSGMINDLRVDVSGASGMKFDGKGNTLLLDVSGASHVDLEASVIGTVRADVSGVSSLEMQGEIGTLEADVSGASSLRAKTARIEVASLEASGASRIATNATNVIKSEASGGSSIR